MATISIDNNKAEIRPDADIVSSTVDGLRTELKNLLNQGVSEMAFDLKGVDVVDSVGLGLIIATNNSLVKKGGKLSVINVSPNVHDLFKSMRLDHHFTVTGA
jgi:anti-anti-sigma factor